MPTRSTPAWLEPLAPRGGPLVPAARAFLAAHPGAPSGPLARGAEGLRGLADALDAWAEQEGEPESADDERFVEGAGALLGCFVLDHFPASAHAVRDGAHRVRLGAHGFFDPFRAVDSALEGPCARGVLVEELARAEDEAAALAGAGRAVALLARRLTEARPELSIADCFDHHVVLSDGVEIDLSRVLIATEGESERAVLAALDKLVSMLPGGASAPGVSLEEARRALLPRLVPPSFLADAKATKDELALRPVLSGALTVALILGYEGRARYVRRRELASWGIDGEEALAIALANLAGRSGGARFARVTTAFGPLVVARSGDGLDAARLLLPTLHDVLAPELGSPFLAAAPHRDALFACALEPRALREALARRAEEDAARAPHRISEQLFTIGPRGIVRAFAE